MNNSVASLLVFSLSVVQVKALSDRQEEGDEFQGRQKVGILRKRDNKDGK